MSGMMKGKSSSEAMFTQEALHYIQWFSEQQQLWGIMAAACVVCAQSTNELDVYLAIMSM